MPPPYGNINYNTLTEIQVHITPSSVTLCGKSVPVTATNEDLIVELYRRYIGDYPKFFKMDLLSRLGFVASELLLQEERRICPDVSHDENRAVILVTRHASIYNDQAYERTIVPENYFPSPSLFVYTLPNVVTGEIAIRNHYYGETSCFVLPDESAAEVFLDEYMPSIGSSAICGWIDVDEKGLFSASLRMYYNN